MHFWNYQNQWRFNPCRYFANKQTDDCIQSLECSLHRWITDQPQKQIYPVISIFIFTFLYSGLQRTFKNISHIFLETPRQLFWMKHLCVLFFLQNVQSSREDQLSIIPIFYIIMLYFLTHNCTCDNHSLQMCMMLRQKKKMGDDKHSLAKKEN